MFKSKINFVSFKSITVSYKILGVVCCVAVSFFGVYLFVHAGNIDSPGLPSSDSGRMYTLEQIYQNLHSGTTATKQSGGFAEPGSAPGSTMHTLDNIYGDFTTDATATSGTVAANVLSGKTFFATSGTTRGTSWGPVVGTIADCATDNGGTCYVSNASKSLLDTNLVIGNIKSGATIFGVSGNLSPDGTAAATDCLLNTTFYSGNSWVQKMGSITTQSLNPANDTVNAGYYSATTLSAVDGDFAVGNIKSGISIFGKEGTFKALLPTTFQTVCYNTAGEVIACGGVAWPDQDADASGDSGACTPTYTQGTYSITDSCTNLEWQRYGHGSNNGYTVPAAAGDCTSGTYNASYCTYTWQNALKYCSNLTLNGSSDWRLPNIKELQSIVNYSIYSPAIDAKFSNTQSGNYWSSTTRASYTPFAWFVFFGGGSVDINDKASSYFFIRCVRGQ